MTTLKQILETFCHFGHCVVSIISFKEINQRKKTASSFDWCI